MSETIEYKTYENKLRCPSKGAGVILDLLLTKEGRMDFDRVIPVPKGWGRSDEGKEQAMGWMKENWGCVHLGFNVIEDGDGVRFTTRHGYPIGIAKAVAKILGEQVILESFGVENVNGKPYIYKYKYIIDGDGKTSVKEDFFPY